MSRPRKHHFLPEFYLAGFTKNGLRNDRIHVLDLRNGRSWNQIPKEVATRCDFYAADLPGFNTVEMEKGLAQLEALLAPVIQSIRKTRTLPTDDIELDYLLNFVATTMARVPKYREILARPLVEFCKQHMRDTVASPEAFMAFQADLREEGITSSATYKQMKAFVESGEYTIDADPATHLQNLILGIEVALKWVSMMAWSLVIADDGAPDFVCSDCPVVPMLDPEHWEDLGLPPQRTPTEIVMPISRRLLLWGLAGARCVLPPVNMPARNVACFNTFIVAWAQRYVFSSDGRIAWGEEEAGIGTTESLIATLLEK